MSEDFKEQGFEEALAERDAQIRELQQAVIELANTIEAAPVKPAISLADGEAAALRQRIGELENRIAEQDHTIRHTLAMLIEWIEADDLQCGAV